VRTSVRIEGMPALRKALLQVSQEGRKTVQREVLRATLAVQRRAKQLCPVDTGRLRNSIAVELEEGGMNGAVGTNVKYAPFVEFGTSRTPAQPYLLPAFEEERAVFIERLKRELGEAFVKASA
jgi:HK97 gp10 family phage protein